MKTNLTTTHSGALARLIKSAFTAVLLPAMVLLLTIQSSHAGSAQWNLNPVSDDWNLPSNWTPFTVPNGPADTATFATSNVTGIHVASDNEVNGITFNAGAAPFTITIDYPSGNLVISGAGITNNSGIIQTFIVKGDLWFYNNATAGSSSQIFEGGAHFFYGNSTAGDATFTVGGDPGDGGGFRGGGMEFHDSSTVGSAIFTLTGDISCGSGNGGITFLDTATAGSGTFVGYGGAICGGGGGPLSRLGASRLRVTASLPSMAARTLMNSVLQWISLATWKARRLPATPP